MTNPPGGESCGQGAHPCPCSVLRSLRSPRSLRWLRAPQVRNALGGRSCTARARRAGTPAGWVGTFAGNNRATVVSASLGWGLFTRLVPGTASEPSSAPAAGQREHAVDCFPARSFPTGRKKCADIPSPLLQKGAVTQAKLFSFAV